MKALFFAIGSRGDAEPFLSIANILRQQGWEIVCIFPEQLRELAEEEGYRFYGFNREFMDIFIKGEQGRMITGGEGSVFKNIRMMLGMMKTILRLTREINQLQADVIRQEQPDYVFYHFKCVYPLLWGMKNKDRSIMVSPFPCTVHAVNDHSIIGFRGGGNYGTFLNRFTYAWQNFFKSVVFYFISKRFRQDFQGIKMNPLSIRRAMVYQEKTIYPLSPTLFPKPAHWHNRIKVIGHFERPKIQHYTPDETLLRFLEQYKKVLFISFGSISHPKPEVKTGHILHVLEKHQIPTIINTSWGGLVKPETYPAHFHFVERIPYDWIFPKVYAVVHHGGAGTTHSALRFGCASLVIPHFIDQFFWAKKVVDLGAGPKGMSIRELREDSFEKAVLEVWNNKVYKEKAEWVAERIQKEGDVEGLMELVFAGS